MPRISPKCTENRKERFRRYPLRKCYTLHKCDVCKGDIILGSLYRDGGYGRRAHHTCVEQMGDENYEDVTKMY